MKGFGVLFMLLLVGAAAIVYLGYCSNGRPSLNQGIASVGRRNAVALTIKRRMLKGDNDQPSKHEDDEVHLEDYRPIDPVPSSTASIRPGPIQHGTPMLPYIPEPSPPPTEAKQGEFP